LIIFIVFFVALLFLTTYNCTQHEKLFIIICFKTNKKQLNGPAPECEPSGCLECQDDFRDDFDDIAGMEFNKAGITERITQDCDDFYRVIHDPCVGISDGGTSSVDAPTPTTPEVSEPAPAEGGTSGSNYSSGTLAMILSLIGMILVVV
jgi:hypothetical protein